MVKSLPQRSEVPAEETWDLNSLFASDKEFNESLHTLEQDVAEFQKQFKGNIQDAASVVDVLTAYLALLEKLVPLSTYASLSLSTDQTNDESISQLYLETLATLPFRIQVLGKMQHLKNPKNEYQIRTLLFSGLRAAMLWQQMGGRRWHFIFKKKAIIASLEQLA